MIEKNKNPESEKKLSNLDKLIDIYAKAKGINFDDAAKMMDRELKKAAKRNGLSVAEFAGIINRAKDDKFLAAVANASFLL